MGSPLSYLKYYITLVQLSSLHYRNSVEFTPIYPSLIIQYYNKIQDWLWFLSFCLSFIHPPKTQCSSLLLSSYSNKCNKVKASSYSLETECSRPLEIWSLRLAGKFLFKIMCTPNRPLYQTLIDITYLSHPYIILFTTLVFDPNYMTPFFSLTYIWC